MITQPFVDINEVTNCPIYAPLISYEHQQYIKQALNTLDIPFSISLEKKLKNEKDINRVYLELVKEQIRNNKTDYDSLWFKWINNKICEFYFRYTGNSIKNFDPVMMHSKYKKVFQIYMMLLSNTNIFNSARQVPGIELDYFIIAQYSSIYSARKGFCWHYPTYQLFLYSSAISNYIAFIQDFNITNVESGVHTYYFLHKLKYNSQVKRSLYLNDHESTIYRDYVVPIINAKLPVLTNKNKKDLMNYLRALEFALYREEFKSRQHTKILLSIEHLRVFTTLYKLLKKKKVQKA